LRFDNRIRKELSSLSSLSYLDVKGIGVCREHDNGPLHKEGINIEYENLSLRSVSISLSYKSLKFFFFFLELFIKQLREALSFRPQIVHCHDAFVLPVGVLLKIFLKCKLIYDAHELESDKFGQSLLFSKVTFLIEKISWRYIDSFITVSPPIEEWYVKKFGKIPTFVILNAPLDLGETTDDTSVYFRNYFSIPHGQRIFVFVGALEGGRRIIELLGIFSSELNNSNHLVFLGFGELKERIIEASSLSKFVHYHEPVSHEKVRDTIKGVDGGFCLIESVSLSDHLCLPNKFFEYANAGIPVISSNLPALKASIIKYGIGLVVESIILEDIVLKLSDLNLVKAPDEFTWSFQEQILLNLYKKL
jgi:glycosyltransferase involved in cell wall biosynthesis